MTELSLLPTWSVGRSLDTEDGRDYDVGNHITGSLPGREPVDINNFF